MPDPTHSSIVIPCRLYMMSQETTAPPKLDVQNSWKEGGLFPLATSISPLFVVGTADASGDQAMSAEAMNVASGMAVLSQGKDFHSFIRCVCAGLVYVHVEICVVQCVCACHIKLTRTPFCACPPRIHSHSRVLLFSLCSCATVGMCVPQQLA